LNRERALEAKVAKSAEREATADEAVDGIANGMTSLPTAESLRGGEQLVQALDAVENILVESNESESGAELIPSASLGNISPVKHFLGALQRIPAADLEQALLLLPFHSVGKIINCLLLVRHYYYCCCTMIIVQTDYHQLLYINIDKNFIILCRLLKMVWS